MSNDVDDWPEAAGPSQSTRAWVGESEPWSLDESDWPDEEDMTPGRHRFSRRRRRGLSTAVSPSKSDGRFLRLFPRAKPLAVVALVLMSALFAWRISAGTTSPGRFAGDPPADGAVTIPDLYTLEPLPWETFSESDFMPTPTAPEQSPSAGQSTTLPSASATIARRVVVTDPGEQRGTAGVPQTLQLHASSTTTGTGMAYSANGLPAGMALNASNGQVSGTPSTVGTTQVLVTATDGSGVSGTVTFTWTIVAQPPTCSGGQRLSNPGFESGDTVWQASPEVIDRGNYFSPRSGSWKAWLAGYSDTHTDTLSQSVSLPSACPRVTLSFWLHVDTDETDNRIYDTLRVEVLSGSGTRLATLATYSNTDDNSGYVQKTFDLSQFHGQDVQISFKAQTDYSRATSFLVDDVELNVASV